MFANSFGFFIPPENGVKKFRVRPHGDPEMPDETEFMSEEEIHAGALEESRK